MDDRANASGLATWSRPRTVAIAAASIASPEAFNGHTKETISVATLNKSWQWHGGAATRRDGRVRARKESAPGGEVYKLQI